MMVCPGNSLDVSISELVGTDQWSPDMDTLIRQSKIWIAEGIDEVRSHPPLPKTWASLFDKSLSNKVNEMFGQSDLLSPEYGPLDKISEEVLSDDDSDYVSTTNFLTTLLSDDDAESASTNQPSEAQLSDDDSGIDDITKEIGRLADVTPSKATLKNQIEDWFQGEIIEKVAQQISSPSFDQEPKTTAQTDVQRQLTVQQQPLQTLSSEQPNWVELYQQLKPLPATSPQMQTLYDFTEKERIPEISEIETRIIGELRGKTILSNGLILTGKNKTMKENCKPDPYDFLGGSYTSTRTTSFLKNFVMSSQMSCTSKWIS